MSLRSRVERLERIQQQRTSSVLDGIAQRLERLRALADRGNPDAQRRLDRALHILDRARERMERAERMTRTEQGDDT